ncbi:UNVERIFIED_CONTAM: hypothetical protein FKN15_034416 [Acipenser sinensis]
MCIHQMQLFGFPCFGTIFLFYIQLEKKQLRFALRQRQNFFPDCSIMTSPVYQEL